MKDRILIIEDEKELSNAITTILELNGFEVFAAGSGRECIQLLNSQDVDLVLCDINLPDITGHDILDYVRSDKRLYRLPFIFLTAYAESVDVRNGMNVGADDYLTKPFLAKDVLAAINSRLSLKRKTGKFFTDDLNRSWLAFFNDNFRQEFVTPLNGIMNATWFQGGVEQFIDGAQRAFAERAAINGPIQGGAADIIKRAMIRMQDALTSAGLSARMLLQVHDELVFEVPDAEIESTAALVKQVMESAVSLSVPLVVETGTALNWAEAH